jgi:hypothetical protein
VWLCPSYKRPENFARLVAACEETAPGISVIVRLDEDDPFLDQYKIPDGWVRLVGPPTKPGLVKNEMLRAFPDESFYGIIADDVIPRTPGWNTILEQAAGDWFIAYPNDLIRGEIQVTHGVMGGALVRTLGWWELPGLVGLFGDTLWYELGKRLELLHYFPNVVLEHVHWSNRKAPKDETYSKRMRPGHEYFSLKDQTLYFDWLHNGGVDRDVMKVKEAWRKIGISRPAR